MGILTPGTMVLIGLLVLLYGLLIGGTWARRNTEQMWDTITTIAFIAIAALATVHLIIVGARQAEAFDKARDRLNCVADRLDAINSRVVQPGCDVHWDR